MGTLIVSLFQIRKLRHKEIQWLAQDYEAGTWHSQTSKPGWSSFMSMAFTTKLPCSLQIADRFTSLLSIYLNTFGFVSDLIQAYTHTHTHSGPFSYASWCSKLLESFPFEVHNVIGFKTPYLAGWTPLINTQRETSEAPVAEEKVHTYKGKVCAIPRGWPWCTCPGGTVSNPSIFYKVV